MNSAAPFSLRRLVMLAVAAFIVVGSLTAFVKDASAVVCPPPTGYKSIGATCYFVNGVVVDSTVMNTGNLNRNPKSFSTAIETLLPGGILFCGNNGGNQPPGQRIIPVNPTLNCNVPVQTSDIVSTKNGGTADVRCDATVDAGVLNDLGMTWCSKGQFALDFVPCEFNAHVTYTDNKKGQIETAKHHCTLPSCETLRWDNKAGMPEFRQYDCQGPIPE